MLGLADCLEIKHSFCQFLFIVQKPVTKCEINKKKTLKMTLIPPFFLIIAHKLVNGFQCMLLSNYPQSKWLLLHQFKWVFW